MIYLSDTEQAVRIKLTVAFAHRIVTGSWRRFGDVPFAIIMAAIIISTPFQAGEEIVYCSARFAQTCEHPDLRTR